MANSKATRKRSQSSASKNPKRTRRRARAPAPPTRWPCTCNQCLDEKEPRKQVCCQQAGRANCIATLRATEITAFNTHVDSDITDELGIWTQGAPPASVDEMTAAQWRMLSYRKLFRMLHSFGRTNVKVGLSSCFRRIIGAASPDASQSNNANQ